MRAVHCFAVCLALLPAVVSAESSSSSASEARWRAAEATHRGQFPAMLEVIESAPRIPHLRLNRPLEDMVQALAQAGRFEDLGVSLEQGRQLVAAFYRRQGLNADGGQRTLDSGAVVANSLPEDYRAGREFDPIEAMLLRWPGNSSSTRDEYAVMIDSIVEAGADAYVWVDSSVIRNQAKRYLTGQGVDLSRVFWVVENTDSIWIRDYGPNFVFGDSADDWGVVDFHYYDSRPEDDDTPLVVANQYGKDLIDRQNQNRVYTEGGNINTDGLGSVLYSERTYDRNPGVAPSVIDDRITSALNSPNNIVLQDPVLDATGHVDMFSKLVDTRTVLVAQYDPDEVDYQRLETNAAILASATNGVGEPWNVVRIRQPDVYYAYFIYPVVRTYTNSILVNDRVIVPTYGIADDAEALALYGQLFPGRTIVPLDANDIIESAGAWHCVTMEFPVPGIP